MIYCFVNIIQALYGKKITEVAAPRYKNFYESRIKKLSKEEFDAAVDYICQLIKDNSGDGYFHPAYNAGKDWSGTPLQPLYEKGCDHNEQDAAYLYGLLIKDVFINYIEEEWIVDKMGIQGRDFEQNYYMKKKQST